MSTVKRPSHGPALIAAARAGLADLLLGVRCAGCAAPGVGWCRFCDLALAPAVAPAPRPLPLPGGGTVPVLAAAEYSGVVRAALLQHKDHGRWGLARPLGRALAAAVRGELGVSAPRQVLLVPVPSTPSRLRDRGYDHALHLARRAAVELTRSGPAAAAWPVLRMTSGRGQVGLGRSARGRNRSGVMQLRRRAGTVATAPGPAVVLVDDITTTGATLREAARVLGSHGIVVHAAAVVAAVEGRMAVSSPAGTD